MTAHDMHYHNIGLSIQKQTRVLYYLSPCCNWPIAWCLVFDWHPEGPIPFSLLVKVRSSWIILRECFIIQVLCMHGLYSNCHSRHTVESYTANKYIICKVLKLLKHLYHKLGQWKGESTHQTSSCGKVGCVLFQAHVVVLADATFSIFDWHRQKYL